MLSPHPWRHQNLASFKVRAAVDLQLYSIKGLTKWTVLTCLKRPIFYQFTHSHSVSFPPNPSVASERYCTRLKWAMHTHSTATAGGIEVLVCALHYIQNDQNTFPSTSASHSLAPHPFLSRQPPSAISIPTQRWQLCPALQWCTLYW